MVPVPATFLFLFFVKFGQMDFSIFPKDIPDFLNSVLFVFDAVLSDVSSVEVTIFDLIPVVDKVRYVDDVNFDLEFDNFIIILVFAFVSMEVSLQIILVLVGIMPWVAHIRVQSASSKKPTEFRDSRLFFGMIGRFFFVPFHLLPPL